LGLCLDQFFTASDSEDPNWCGGPENTSQFLNFVNPATPSCPFWLLRWNASAFTDTREWHLELHVIVGDHVRDQSYACSSGTLDENLAA